MDWKPKLGDILWLDSMIHLTSEGGLLVYPNTQLIYKVERSKRRFTLMNPQVLSASVDAAELHRRTKVILKHLEFEMESVGGGG